MELRYTRFDEVDGKRWKRKRTKKPESSRAKLYENALILRPAFWS